MAKLMIPQTNPDIDAFIASLAQFPISVDRITAEQDYARDYTAQWTTGNYPERTAMDAAAMRIGAEAARFIRRNIEALITGYLPNL